MRSGTIHIQDFAGGLNLRDSPYSVNPNEAVECENFIFSRTGEAEMRSGYDLYGDVGTDKPVQGLYRFYTEDDMYLLTASDGKVFVNLHNPVPGWDDTAHFSFATWDWKNTCFLANGVDSLFMFDGTNFSEVPNAPASPRHVTVYANRLWVAGVDGDTTIVRWSALGDFTEWPATNFAAAQGPVTGLVPSFGQLYIFTQNRVEVLIGTGGANTTQGVQTLVDGTGCVAPRTIASHAGVTFFLGHEGVWQLMGGMARLISRNIDPVVARLSPEQRESAVGVIYDGRYWLSFVSQGERVIYVYDIQHGWWTKFTGIDATTFVVFEGVNDDPLFLTGDSKGRVWRQDVGFTDDGEQISAMWKSKVFHPATDWNCQYRDLALRSDGLFGTPQVEWIVDSGRESGIFVWSRSGSGSLWGQMVWGVDSWSDFSSLRFTSAFPMRAVGESIQFTIRHTGRGSFHDLTAKVRPKRRVV